MCMAAQISSLFTRTVNLGRMNMYLNWLRSEENTNVLLTLLGTPGLASVLFHLWLIFTLGAEPGNLAGQNGVKWMCTCGEQGLLRFEFETWHEIPVLAYGTSREKLLCMARWQFSSGISCPFPTEPLFGLFSGDLAEENKHAEVLRYSFLWGSCLPSGYAEFRASEYPSVVAVAPFLGITGLWWPKRRSKLLEWRFDLSTFWSVSSILLFGSSSEGILNCTICLVSLDSAELLSFRRQSLNSVVVEPFQVTSSASANSLADVWRHNWWEPLACGRKGKATGLTGEAGGVLQGLFGKITKEEQRLSGILDFRRSRVFSWVVLCLSGPSDSKMLLLLQ